MSDQTPVPAADNTFERIKRVSPEGNESWSARDLARVLEDSEFRHFQPVIEKAKEACLKSNHRIEDHFEQILDMVSIGSGAQREIEDWALSRYACYLVIQNADPSKPLVALGQTYFAVQTRRQELADDAAIKEDKTRLLVRAEIKKHNKYLAGVAKEAGVVQPLDYAIFMDHGYRGLYGELTRRDIHRRKKLTPKQNILDHMGKHRTGRKPVSSHANRGKAPPRKSSFQESGQPDSPPSRAQGAPDHPRAGRDHAGKSARCREHQKSGKPREKTSKSRSEKGTSKAGVIVDSV